MRLEVRTRACVKSFKHSSFPPTTAWCTSENILSPRNKLRRNPRCMPTGSRRETHETTAALREGELSDLRANSRKREASAKDVREARKKRRSRKHRRPTRRIRRVKLQESGPKNATHSRHPSAGWFDTSLQNTTEVVPEYTVAET